MTNTYDASRAPLGKLPTDFTRPTSCNTPWIGTGFLEYAVTCSTTSGAQPHIEYDDSCYPPPWAKSGDHWPEVAFFSPASICPQGFTSACNVTKNVFDSAAASLTFGERATDEVLFVLTDGETAIGCCPTGFACDSLWVQSCTSVLSTPGLVSGLTYGRSCSSSPTFLSMATSSDLLGFSLLTTAHQLNVLIVHNPAKDNGTTSSSGGLSTGAKIGLGVGIPLAVIAVAASIFIYCYRKRKLEKEKLRQKERLGEKLSAEPALPPHLSKPELQGSDGTAVTDARGQALDAKPELDNKTTTSATVRSEDPKSTELDSSQTGTGSRYELESPTSATITNIAELSGDPYRYELDAGDDARFKTADV